MPTLPSFEDQEVGAVALAVTRAGDGLSEALKIDPVVHHIGDEVCLVIKGVIGKVNHVPLKDSEMLKRVEVLIASQATIVDEGLVADVLEDQQKRIDQAKGLAKLEFPEDDPAADLDGPDASWEQGE